VTRFHSTPIRSAHFFKLSKFYKCFQFPLKRNLSRSEVCVFLHITMTFARILILASRKVDTYHSHVGVGRYFVDFLPFSILTSFRGNLMNLPPFLNLSLFFCFNLMLSTSISCCSLSLSLSVSLPLSRSDRPKPRRRPRVPSPKRQPTLPFPSDERSTPFLSLYLCLPPFSLAPIAPSRAAGLEYLVPNDNQLSDNQLFHSQATNVSPHSSLSISVSLPLSRSDRPKPRRRPRVPSPKRQPTLAFPSDERITLSTFQNLGSGR
jgi:hypothetical protein